MDRAGPLLSMFVTAALMIGGAVLGCLNPGEGSRITAAFGFAIGGLMVAAYIRVLVFHALLPVWRRVTFTTQVGWMALQVGFTLFGLWAGLTSEPQPDMSPAGMALVCMITGFGMGLAVTALWAWSYDLFRYSLPRLVRGGLQKVRGRQNI